MLKEKRIYQQGKNGENEVHEIFEEVTEPSSKNKPRQGFNLTPEKMAEIAESIANKGK